MSVGFLGLSHLGIVSSVATASKGFEVIAYDADAALVRRLSRGELPIAEPQLPELLAEHRTHLRFTSDPAALAACAVIVCSADVPTDEENRSDLSRIHTLIDTAVAHAKDAATLVVLSQVPPGFTRALADRLNGMRPLHVCYQVETLIFGRAVERAMKPERSIVGCRDPQHPLPPAYAALLGAFGCPIFRIRYESAELAKIALNMLLVSSVSTANTLAELCEAIGADWSEIVPALQADRRIGHHAYLKPGLGLSGGNLERDLATVRGLAGVHGTEIGVVDAWLANSRHRRDWALRRLHEQVLSRAADPVIAVWGLAYKPHTHSTKHSPAVALLEALRPFAVRVYDPQVRLPAGAFPNCAQAGSALDACQGADALAIMTAWPEFAVVDVSQLRGALRGSVVLDPFGMLGVQRCAKEGLAQFRLGSRAALQEPVPC